MTTFDRFENRTLLTATLEMRTALSVGGRASSEPVGTDLPVIRGGDGLPFIPGSSIKGIIRTEMERVLRAVNRPPDFYACEPFETPCISKAFIDQLPAEVTERDAYLSDAIWRRTCEVCRLFGTPWMSGRLAFKDAMLQNTDELPVVTQVRDGVGIERDLGTARSGIKYDFEVVVPGAQFGIQVVAENTENWEIGLLLAVLRPWMEGMLAIGGKITRGPGWGLLTNVTIHQVTRAGLLPYMLHGAMIESTIDTFVQAFQTRVTVEGE